MKTLCFTDKHIFVPRIKRKIAAAIIQLYFVNFVRNYSFTVSLDRFLLNVMLKEQPYYNSLKSFGNYYVEYWQAYLKVGFLNILHGFVFY